MPTREERLRNLQDGDVLDVIVIGGGTTGASIYHRLCSLGYRVALADKGDFASGTSQASGMLIWGGLLYLKNFDIRTVRKLCRSRDEMINSMSNDISPCNMRFLFSKQGRYSPWFAIPGLYLYWLLGSSARRFPMISRSFPEKELIQIERYHKALEYEEAFLRHSDSRFVLNWITQFNNEDCIPFNHCAVARGQYAAKDKLWYLDMVDQISGIEFPVRARRVINAGGVWTDEINSRLGIRSRYRHVMSKGVYLAFHRDAQHDDSLIFDLERNGEVLTYVPWGRVAMWGPTETSCEDREAALVPDAEDCRYLLRAANQHLRKKVGAEDIISVRSGIRPLGVPRNYSKNVYPLELSRKYLVEEDKERRAIAVYGGKLTASGLLAGKVADLVMKDFPPSRKVIASGAISPQMEPCMITGIPEVTPAWSRDHEFCETLEDFLRRRTNISQWTERMGMGRGNEHRPAIEHMAADLTKDPDHAARMVDQYVENICKPYDAMLESV